MSDFLGIPRHRLPVAVAMVAALAAVTVWLQSRFEGSDVKKGIAIAMGHKLAAGGPSVFDAIVARREGDPRCDGKVVSTLLGDVQVACTTPGRPGASLEFRVLIDGKRPPRAANAEAERLFAQMK